MKIQLFLHSHGSLDLGNLWMGLKGQRSQPCRTDNRVGHLSGLPHSSAPQEHFSKLNPRNVSALPSQYPPWEAELQPAPGLLGRLHNLGLIKPHSQPGSGEPQLITQGNISVPQPFLISFLIMFLRLLQPNRERSSSGMGWLTHSTVNRAF